MKKLALIVVVLIATLTSFGQVVSKGEHYASAFIGLGGNVNLYNSYGMLIPPVGAQYEVIVTDKVGIGHVGVSGIATYSASSYRYTNLYHSMYHHVTIGARGAYHFDLSEFFDDAIFRQLDAYAGLMLGMNYTLETSSDQYYSPDFTRLVPIADLCVGGRYFFNDNIAVMAELGFNVSYLSIGLTMKLNK